MHNVEQSLPNNLHQGTTAAPSANSNMTRRNLNCPGQGGGPMHCVDIAESWLAAGGESPTIRIWDFTKAAEAAAKAAAARAARNSAKRVKQRKAAAAAGEGSKASKRGGRISSSTGRKGGEIVVGVESTAADAGSSRTAAAGTAAAVGPSSSAAAASGLDAAGCSSSSKKPKGLLAAAAAAAKAANSTEGLSSGSHTGSQAAHRYHRMQHAHVARQQQQQRQQACVGDGSTQQWPEPSGAKGKHVLHHHKQGYQHSNGYHQSSQGSYGHSPRAVYGPYGTSPQCAGSYGSSPQYAGSYGSSPQQYHHQWPAGAYGSSPQQQWYGASPPYGWHNCAGSTGRGYASPWQSQRKAGKGSRHYGDAGQHQAATPDSTRRSTDEGVAGVPIPSCSSRHQSRQAAGDCSVCDGASSSPFKGPAATAVVESSCSEGGCQMSASPSTATAGCSYRVPFSSSYPSASQTGPWLVTGMSPRYDAVVAREVCSSCSTAGASKSRLSGGAAAVHGTQRQVHEELATPGSLSN